MRKNLVICATLLLVLATPMSAVHSHSSSIQAIDFLSAVAMQTTCDDDGIYNVTTNNPADLVAAVADANVDICNDTPQINLLANATYTFTTAADNSSFFGDSALPLITKSMTINGNNATVQITTTPMRFVYLLTLSNEPTTVLTVTNLTVRGGNPLAGVDSESGESFGGAFLAGGATLNLEGVTLENNQADIGGAVSATEGLLQIRDSAASRSTVFQNNTSNVNAGAIVVDNNTLTVNNATFTGNQVVGSLGAGGALSVRDSVATIESTTFDQNTAKQIGGAIQALGGELTLRSSTFSQNEAEDSGGAIFSNNGDNTSEVEVFDSTFDENLAGLGGALIIQNGNSTIAGNSFARNVANDSGGALTILDSNIVLEENTFSENRAGANPTLTQFGQGGAIQHLGGGDVTLRNNSFTSNSADFGGAIYHFTETMTSINNEYNANIADIRAGAVYVEGDTVTMRGDTFLGNRARSGGAIIVGAPSAEASEFGGILNIEDTTFQANDAFGTGFDIIRNSIISYGYGGAIGNFGTVTIENSLFAGNIAAVQSGAVDNQINSTLNVTNTTFVGNEAGVDANVIGSANGLVAIYFATVVDNGAPNSNVITLDYTDVAGNDIGGMFLYGTYVGNAGTNCIGVTSIGFNMASDASCGFGSNDNVSASFEPLSENGGSTQSRTPEIGSPLIDQIPAAQCVYDHDQNSNTPNIPLPVDQNGRTRPANDACDIGAVEFGALLELAEDVNDDGRITPADVMYVINRVDTNDFSADVDGNQVVNQADIDQVLALLGTTGND